MIPNITVTLPDGRVVHYTPSRFEVPAIDLTPNLNLAGQNFSFQRDFYQTHSTPSAFISTVRCQKWNINSHKLIYIRRLHKFSVELHVSHRSGIPFNIDDMVRIPKPNGKTALYRITHVRDCTTQSAIEYLAVFHPSTKPIKR